jgi:hypothetical protein
MPSLGGEGEVDGDLAVLDTARRARVLPLAPDRRGALLDIASLVNRKDPQTACGVAPLGGVSTISERTRSSA